jgi:hypothetical protein
MCGSLMDRGRIERSFGIVYGPVHEHAVAGAAALPPLKFGFSSPGAPSRSMWGDAKCIHLPSRARRSPGLCGAFADRRGFARASFSSDCARVPTKCTQPVRGRAGHRTPEKPDHWHRRRLRARGERLRRGRAADERVNSRRLID